MKAMYKEKTEMGQTFLEPVLTVENQNTEIGKYGRMALRFLKETHPHRYNFLRSEGILMQKMKEVNEESHLRMKVIQEEISKAKSKEMIMIDPMNFYENYKHKEMIRTWAEEIVLKEIVYKVR